MPEPSINDLLRLCSDDAPTLLVLDENCAQIPPAPPRPVKILSNRFDVYRHAVEKQWDCAFSDYDFNDLSTFSPHCIAYRVSKEKRVVEHIVQSSWQRLPIGGELILIGYKNEGIKTFAKRIANAFNCESSLQRGDAHLHIYRFVKSSEQFATLGTDDYHALRSIGEYGGHQVFSKPGIFCWDRFDEGSLFLLAHLQEFLASCDLQTARGVDLGCGYGLLALALLTAGCSDVTATDNNAAAIKACQFTLDNAGFGARAHVVTDDCGASLPRGFDVVLCNPPFHQGFDVEQDLTDRFLQTTKRLLNKNGRALFVVNSFIALERKATPLFNSVQTLADNRKFKLVALTV